MVSSDFSKQITINSLSGGSEQGFFRDIPEICSICGSRITPYPIAFSDSTDKLKGFFEKAYLSLQCTGKCGRIKFAIYKLSVAPGNTTHYDFVDLHVVVPKEVKTPEITPEIANISPSFVTIYKQALATEALNLTQMTGLGLRKAFEFLIKDYVSSKFPENQEVIKKKPLGACINEYLKEDYLKECARRATWLGNDETHYSREWESHDAEDLKKLILLTLRWLEYAILSERYFCELPSRDQPAH